MSWLFLVIIKPKTLGLQKGGLKLCWVNDSLLHPGEALTAGDDFFVISQGHIFIKILLFQN